MLATYPPFGFATSSTSGLSAFLILIGLYSSAVSVSQDSKLRQSIKKIATKDVDLLSSIGTAQMEQEIQRTVNSMKNVVEEQEKELEEQTGIEANLGEDEMKNYLEEVMQEIGKVKKPSI
jgi:Tfp pilus assembly PilM family ATPase